MQTIDVTETTWQNILALRLRAAALQSVADAACALYAPIAGAKGLFVIAQVGQSLDGRVATPSGDARDISGADGLIHLHRCRALVDAVIVGVNTVMMDNPRLSVRMVNGPSPVRVIIDCNGQLDGSQKLFSDGGTPVIVFQSITAPKRDIPNAEVIRLMPDKAGLNTQAILDVLLNRGFHRILVEGGARTITRFIEAGHIDRLHVAVSPIIIGSGPSGINLSSIEKLSSARRPATTVYDLGSDILFDCELRSDKV